MFLRNDWFIPPLIPLTHYFLCVDVTPTTDPTISFHVDLVQFCWTIRLHLLHDWFDIIYCSLTVSCPILSLKVEWNIFGSFFTNKKNDTEYYIIWTALLGLARISCQKYHNITNLTAQAKVMAAVTLDLLWYTLIQWWTQEALLDAFMLDKKIKTWPLKTPGENVRVLF